MCFDDKDRCIFNSEHKQALHKNRTRWTKLFALEQL